MNKLFDIVSTVFGMVAAVSLTFVLVTGAYMYLNVDCDKNTNGSYSCETRK